MAFLRVDRSTDAHVLASATEAHIGGNRRVGTWRKAERRRKLKTQVFRDDRRDSRRPMAGSPVAFGVHATAIGMGPIYLGISTDIRHALLTSPGQWNGQRRAKPWSNGESWHAAIFVPCRPMAYQLPRPAMRWAKHSHAAEAPCKTRGPSHAQQPPLPRRDHATSQPVGSTAVSGPTPWA